MPDPFRELVTGSRMYGDLATIRTVMIEAQADRPPGRMTLVHGQCPPRHPHTKRPIPWKVAERLSRIEQSYLRGADWLAAWIAVDLGWVTEPHPADWEGPCRPTCQRGHRRGGRRGSICPAAGDYRNEDMVATGVLRCDGFLLPCRDPGCRRTEPHATHGADGCLTLAEAAGIRTERHT